MKIDAEKFKAWLTAPVPTTEYRTGRAGLINPQLYPDVSPTTTRDRVSAKEVWVEFLGLDAGHFNQTHARAINRRLRELLPGWKETGIRNGPYGSVRGFAQTLEDCLAKAA
ncbi:hypothetical protein CCP4SC76_2160013 [Gammaproteobacteria bacterium]